MALKKTKTIIFIIFSSLLFPSSQRHRDVRGWTILKWILERWYGVDWIDMAQDRDQWRALVNAVLSWVVPEWLLKKGSAS
jgi:hypothetical protein